MTIGYRIIHMHTHIYILFLIQINILLKFKLACMPSQYNIHTIIKDFTDFDVLFLIFLDTSMFFYLILYIYNFLQHSFVEAKFLLDFWIRLG